MANRKKTKITVETERLFVISSSGKAAQRWCEACGERVRVITAEQAAIIAGVGLMAICHRVDADTLHHSEDADGMLFICLNSLLRETSIECGSRIERVSEG